MDDNYDYNKKKIEYSIKNYKDMNFWGVILLILSLFVIPLTILFGLITGDIYKDESGTGWLILFEIIPTIILFFSSIFLLLLSNYQLKIYKKKYKNIYYK